MMKFSNKVLEQRRLALQTYLQVSMTHHIFQRGFTGKPYHNGICIYFPFKLGTTATLSIKL